MTYKTFALAALCLFSQLSASDIVQTQATFQPQQKTFHMKVSATTKDHANLKTVLKEICATVNSQKISKCQNGYQLFAIFFESIKAAIAAGLNIQLAVATSQEPIHEIIIDAAEAAYNAITDDSPEITAAVATTATSNKDTSDDTSISGDNNDANYDDNAVALDDNQTDTDQNAADDYAALPSDQLLNGDFSSFTIAITITVNRPEDVALWQNVIALMETIFEQNTVTAEIPQDVLNYINQNSHGSLSCQIVNIDTDSSDTSDTDNDAINADDNANNDTIDTDNIDDNATDNDNNTDSDTTDDVATDNDTQN